MAFVMQVEREHNTNKYKNLKRSKEKKMRNKFGKFSLRT